MEGTVFPSAASPDGRELLALATSGDGEAHVETLFVYPVAGGPPRQLSLPASRIRSPSWSPDGRWVAYASSVRGFSDIFVVRADGGESLQLTHDERGAFEPAFSPDGERLAFVSTVDGDPEVYVMAPDEGAGQRRGAGGGIEPASASPPGSEREAVWSPDGRKLAFARQRPGGRSEIWIAHLGQGTSAALTDGRADDSMPSWSPDGRYLAFVSDRTGDPELFIMRADGGGQTRITSSKGVDWRPLWIPNPETGRGQ